LVGKRLHGSSAPAHRASGSAAPGWASRCRSRPGSADRAGNDRRHRCGELRAGGTTHSGSGPGYWAAKRAPCPPPASKDHGATCGKDRTGQVRRRASAGLRCPAPQE